jgi:hypothetical protein
MASFELKTVRPLSGPRSGGAFVYPGHSMLFSCATKSGVRREATSGQN